jgi:hypothetical protein
MILSICSGQRRIVAPDGGAGSQWNTSARDVKIVVRAGLIHCKTFFANEISRADEDGSYTRFLCGAPRL